MAERLIEIDGRVEGDKKIGFLLGYSPTRYRQAIIDGFIKERNMFIGLKRGKAGVFRRKLERKKLKGGRIGRKKLKGGRKGQTWARQITQLFTGKVSGGKQKTADITLSMGLFYRHKKQVHEMLEFLGTGGTITSSGEMIIPIYKNLIKLGYKPKTGMSGQVMRRYGRRGTDHFLVRVPAGGFTLYYDAKLLAEGSPTQALMFLGVHKITVKKQFDIYGDWKKREAKAITRIQKRLDKTSNKLNK